MNRFTTLLLTCLILSTAYSQPQLAGLTVEETYTISIINDVTSEGELVLRTKALIQGYPNPVEHQLFFDSSLKGLK